MIFDTGTIVVICSMAVFYIYIYILRRGKQRRKRLETLEAMKNIKEKSKKGTPQKPLPAPNSFYTPLYEVRSWFIIFPAIFLMLIGLSLKTTPWLPQMYADYWWVITTIGVLIFTAGFK